MKGTAFIILFILFVKLGGMAQEMPAKPTALSLEEALDYAQQNNTTLTNAKLDVLLADKKVWEYISTGLPQVNGNINYQHIFKVPEMNFQYSYTIPSYIYNIPGDPLSGINYIEYNTTYVDNPVQLGSPDNATFDLNVSQMIFSSSFFVGLQTAKIYKRMSEQNLNKTQLDIRETVASSYYTALIAQRSKVNLENNLENLNQTIFEMGKSFEAGFIEDTDVDQLKLTATNIKNTIISLERQAELAMYLLKVQLGLDLEDPLELKDNLDNLIAGIQVDNLISDEFNAENSIDFQLISTQEVLTNQQYKLQKGSFLPYISAFYRHQEQANAPDLNFSSPDIMGVTVNVPIFSSGMRLSKTSQAKIELEKIRNTKSEMEKNLKMQYEQTKAELQTAIDTYKNQKENVELSERIYNKNLTKYKQGVGTSTALTQSHNQLLSAQSNYYSAIFQLLGSKNKLERILNKL